MAHLLSRISAERRLLLGLLPLGGGLVRVLFLGLGELLLAQAGGLGVGHVGGVAAVVVVVRVLLWRRKERLQVHCLLGNRMNFALCLPVLAFISLDFIAF